jgi:SPP1 family predicted phage head-tail adaptor
MITDFFTQTIVIQRATSTPNAFGGNSQTWATHLSIKGYIDRASGKELDIARKTTPETTDILLCASGYDITINDRVYFGGKIYRVVAPPDTVFGHHAETSLEYVGVDV